MAEDDNQLPGRDSSLLPGRAVGRTPPEVTLKEPGKALGGPVFHTISTAVVRGWGIKGICETSDAC